MTVALLTALVLASTPRGVKPKPGISNLPPPPKHAPVEKARPVPQPRSVGDYFDAIDYAMDAENYLAAERMAREGMARYPQAVGWHLLIGDALAAREKLADAFYEYQWETMRAGPERPSGAEAQAKAGEILQGRGTDVDELRVVAQAVQDEDADPAKSAAIFASHAERRPDAYVLRVLQAEALVKANRPGDAIGVYRDLIARDGYFVPAYVELAEALEKAGKGAEGRALIAKAREIDGDHWRLKSVPAQ